VTTSFHVGEVKRPQAGCDFVNHVGKQHSGMDRL
jgi:hypothetical protein